MRTPHFSFLILAIAGMTALSIPARAVMGQSVATDRVTDRHSRNVQFLGQMPLGGEGRSLAVHLDQAPDRPFVYTGGPGHITVLDIARPAFPVEQVSVSTGDHAVQALTSFRHDGRSFLVGATTGGAAPGLVWDVTDPSRPMEMARMHAASQPESGFVNVFAYKASGGQSWLFAAGGGAIHVYAASDLAQGRADPAWTIELPEPVPGLAYGFKDVYAAWHAETETDRLYAAGAGGYFVYDISDASAPAIVTIVNSAAVQVGSSIVATPDGTHITTTAGYATAPLRIFDLRPALDGTVSRVRTAAGAWTATWQHNLERHAVRWPFIFVAAKEDGLQVVNMRNPFEPYTDAFFHTWQGPLPATGQPSIGAQDVDVRNADGLIAVVDLHTGLYLLHVEAFDSWDGRGWGLPNVSSVQNWTDGPVGAESWN